MKLNRIWRAGLSALSINGEASSMSTKLFLPGATRDRSPRFISRHLTLWSVLLILGGMVVLSSVLAGARTESRKNGARAEQMRSIKSVDGLDAQSRMMSVKREREKRAVNPYPLTTSATTLAESYTSEQQSNAQDQTLVIDGASAQEQEGPLVNQRQEPTVLTMRNVPSIPVCRGIVRQSILDEVNASTEDPGEIFERNRREHPHMIMMPPPLDCASQLWKAARRGQTAEEMSIDPELISARQFPIESVFDMSGLSALVGNNIDPANGVEGYQGETSISIDPNNPLHIVAHSNTFFKDTNPQCQSPTGGTANTYGTMALFGSSDGGATWTYNCAPWPATVTGGVTGATFWFGSDPALAWDNQGRAYATYMLISQSSTASGASIVTARSSDNGLTWQSLGTVTSGITSTTIGNDKEMMAIDTTSGQTFSHPGRIYVIWDAANAEKIAYSDNGSTWTTVNFASNTGAIGGNVVVGADGTVYAIWSRYNVETIVFSKSTDGGATWTAPAVIATLALQSFGTNNLPPAQDQRGVNGFGAIDIDRNPNSAFFNTLYVSFPDFPAGTTSGTDINTYVIRSTNGGTSWSTRVKVNDDNFTATQIFPWLAVDQSDGTVNVSWIDTRLDPLNRKTQAVYARSSDGGASFEPNILVTDGGVNWRNNANYSDENSTDNPTYNGNQYGDYIGIAALNRQVHPLWTDSRMFFPSADTQSPTRREDNATATIINCSAPAAISAPSVNSSTAPNVAISWSAPAGWGTNATNGTYSVYRNTSPSFPSGSALASGLTSTSYVDTTGVNGTTYYYFVRGKNNCPGTLLTPMSTDSAASAAVVFGSAGTATGVLQGTVTSGGLPLSGVVVNAGSYSATTNGSGVYQFPAINAGTYTVSASPAGYSPATVNGVVVTDGATTVQNLSLMPIASGSCFTDTTFADFSTGSGSNADISVSPGDVKLAILGGEAADQVSSPAALSTTNNLSATTWTGQTFRAGVTGSLKKLNVGLGLASGTSGTITVEIRNLNGVNPGTTVLGSGTLGPVTNVGTAAVYTTTLTSPAAVVSGTSYSIVLRTSVGSTVFGVRGSTAGGSTLANGQVFTTTTSGTSWTAVAADLYFTTFVTPPLAYQTSGNFISSVKDAGQVVGLAPRWLTLSWNATTPANTTVQFQAAASDNPNGPFNFVGPDGTASTFFTDNGSSLSRFNGFRYLKYKALLSTTSNTVTPVLNDVTVCFDNDTPMITAAAPLSRQQAGDAVNAQIATVSDPGQAANQLIVTSTPVTGTGVVISNIFVDAEGRVTADVAAGCAATNSTFTLTVTNGANATATATLTVNVTAIDTPTITPDGPTTFCAGGSVMLTSSSASGNQWYLDGNLLGGATNQSYNATSSGDYAVTVNVSGCPINPSAPTTVTVNPTPATPTITPDGPTTFCSGGSVTLTSSSTSGNQWYLDGNPIGGATNQAYIAMAAGNYTDTVTANGCASQPSSATAVTVNPTPAIPTITPDGPTTFCNGGSVTLTSSGATGNQWYLNGNPIGGATNQAYTATASGNYTVTNTTTGCTSAPSSAVTVTVNPTPATPTITPNGPTTFCDSVMLTSSSASGNQWYLNGTPIGGATNQTYSATTSGDFTVVATTGGCSSAPSARMKVAANTAPELTYQNQAVIFNGSLTFNPATGPSDNISVSSIIVQSVGTYTGTISVNNTTGAVSISNAAPAGTHTITIRATDACNAFAEASFTLTISKADQTIVFGTLTGKSYGNAPFTVSGTGGASGNPLTFSSLTPTVCTVSANTVTILNAGVCTIRASQAGTSNYNAAADVDRSFTVAKASQTIAVTTHAPASATYDSGFTVAASSDSALPVTYTSAGVCTNTGATFNMTSGAGVCTVRYDVAGDANHNAATQVVESVTAQKMAATITLSNLSQTYDGSVKAATATTNPAGKTVVITYSQGGSAAASPTNAGSYAVSAVISDVNYQGSATNTLVINRATPTLTWNNPADITYGTTLSATQLNATASVAGAFLYTPASGTTLNAGSNQTLSVSFTSTDTANYNPAVASVSVNVLKAAQTITFAPLPVMTFGEADFNVSGQASSGLSLSFTATGQCTITGAAVHITGAGSCTITASQPGNGNFNAALSVNQPFTINKAAASVTLSNLSQTHDGSVKAATATTNPAGKTVVITYSQGGSAVASPINAGSYDVTATINEADYQGSSTGTLVISKGTPVIDWNNPADITYGTALSGTQLNATASVPGAFLYTPASGATLNAGSNQTLSVSFTPTDTANYNAHSASVSINVLKANQTLTFDALSAKTYGDPDFNVTATASSGLGVTFTATGQCVITGPALHITAAGSCTITASQNGDSNYNTAPSIDLSFSIGKATVNITLSDLSQTYDGKVKAPTAVTDPTGLTVLFTYNRNGQQVPSPINAGSYTVTAAVSQDNYQGSATGLLVINKAVTLITWNNPSNIIYGVALSSTQLNASASVEGTFQFNPPAGTVLEVGTHQLSASFTPTDTDNYTTAAKNVTLTVDPVPTASLSFSSAAYAVEENAGQVAITVKRSGAMTVAVTVNYATSDDAGLKDCNVVNRKASSRCDYATTVGTLRFAAGESSKVISIPIVNDVYLEGGSEVFTISLSNVFNAELGSPSTATVTINDADNGLEPNPIDNDAFFIRQLYIDFLGREPEPGAVNNWLAILNHCSIPSDCDRNAVAMGFVRSAEFRDRGYFVYRFYSASLGRIPHYTEFIPDIAKVSGFLSDQDLEANKTAYIAEFMNRAEFKALYDVTLNNPTAYVDKLLSTAVLPNHPRRAEWIAGLTNNTLTRAQVLRQFIESTEVFTKYYNEAFIVMNYFGFLRRDPDAAYQTWIQIFNQSNDDRVIINGFINSQEYRNRFGR